MLCTPVSYSFCSPVYPCDLHSFPTRRSSDLTAARRPDVRLARRRNSRNRQMNRPSPSRINTIPAIINGTISGESRSEEHTSELQSRGQLVCRLLLEKKKNKKSHTKQQRILHE